MVGREPWVHLTCPPRCQLRDGQARIPEAKGGWQNSRSAGSACVCACVDPSPQASCASCLGWSDADMLTISELLDIVPRAGLVLTLGQAFGHRHGDGGGRPPLLLLASSSQVGLVRQRRALQGCATNPATASTTTARAPRRGSRQTRKGVGGAQGYGRAPGSSHSLMGRWRRESSSPLGGTSLGGTRCELSLAFHCRGAGTWHLSGCTRPARVPAAVPSARDAPPTEAAPAASDRAPSHTGHHWPRGQVGVRYPGRGRAGLDKKDGSRCPPWALTAKGHDPPAEG